MPHIIHSSQEPAISETKTVRTESGNVYENDFKIYQLNTQ